jgi:hypothetical protein
MPSKLAVMTSGRSGIVSHKAKLEPEPNRQGEDDEYVTLS